MVSYNHKRSLCSTKIKPYKKIKGIIAIFISIIRNKGLSYLYGYEELVEDDICKGTNRHLNDTTDVKRWAEMYF